MGLYTENSSSLAPFLDLRHVHVARGESVVLHDVNLAVRPGEHIAILGPNGCGKSTLIKTITCECYPLVQEETSIEIFGRTRWDLTELKKKLGVVSVELPGKPTLSTSGRDAVLTGFFSSSTLWPNLVVTPEMKSRADEIMHLVSATDLSKKQVGAMSVGQQRRIMIARALVASAGTLLLDEPSNALDLAAQKDLYDLLRVLAQGGTTILLITHHLPDIIPEIGRILMMREGRVVGDGTKEELLTPEKLSELFQTRVELTRHDGRFYAS